MKCYEKNTCNVYNLQFLDPAGANTDAATSNWKCVQGSTTHFSFDLIGKFHEMFDTVFE